MGKEIAKEKVVVRPDVEEQKPVEVPKKQEFKARYELATIATQTEEIIVDSETQQELDVKNSLVLILNKLDKIEKTLL